ncbi:hypothetical protein ACFE04_015611 [Oxalis oulophora]
MLTCEAYQIFRDLKILKFHCLRPTGYQLIASFWYRCYFYAGFKHLFMMITSVQKNRDLSRGEFQTGNNEKETLEEEIRYENDEDIQNLGLSFFSDFIVPPHTSPPTIIVDHQVDRLWKAAQPLGLTRWSTDYLPVVELPLSSLANSLNVGIVNND